MCVCEIATGDIVPNIKKRLSFQKSLNQIIISKVGSAMIKSWIKYFLVHISPQILFIEVESIRSLYQQLLRKQLTPTATEDNRIGKYKKCNREVGNEVLEGRSECKKG